MRQAAFLVILMILTGLAPSAAQSPSALTLTDVRIDPNGHMEIRWTVPTGQPDSVVVVAGDPDFRTILSEGGAPYGLAGFDLPQADHLFVRLRAAISPAEKTVSPWSEIIEVVRTGGQYSRPGVPIPAPASDRTPSRPRFLEASQVTLTLEGQIVPFSRWTTLGRGSAVTWNGRTVEVTQVPLDGLWLQGAEFTLIQDHYPKNPHALNHPIWTMATRVEWLPLAKPVAYGPDSVATDTVYPTVRLQAQPRFLHRAVEGAQESLPDADGTMAVYFSTWVKQPQVYTVVAGTALTGTLATLPVVKDYVRAYGSRVKDHLTLGGLLYNFPLNASSLKDFQTLLEAARAPDSEPSQKVYLLPLERAVDTRKLGGKEVQFPLEFTGLQTFRIQAGQDVWYVSTPFEQLGLSMTAVAGTPGLKVRVDPQLK